MFSDFQEVDNSSEEASASPQLYGESSTFPGSAVLFDANDQNSGVHAISLQ
jgi:hypothetical protein